MKEIWMNGAIQLGIAVISILFGVAQVEKQIKTKKEKDISVFYENLNTFKKKNNIFDEIIQKHIFKKTAVLIAAKSFDVAINDKYSAEEEKKNYVLKKVYLEREKENEFENFIGNIYLIDRSNKIIIESLTIIYYHDYHLFCEILKKSFFKENILPDIHIKNKKRVEKNNIKRFRFLKNYLDYFNLKHKMIKIVLEKNEKLKNDMLYEYLTDYSEIAKKLKEGKTGNKIPNEEQEIKDFFFKLKKKATNKEIKKVEIKIKFLLDEYNKYFSLNKKVSKEKRDFDYERLKLKYNYKQ